MRSRYPILRIVLSLLALLLCQARSLYAQSSSGLTARVLYPPRNYEILLGDTLIPRARIINAGTAASTGALIRFEIRNAVSLFAVYHDSIMLPTLLPGDSTDVTFAAYVTNLNKLQQLGTFSACLTIEQGQDVCSDLFGVRRVAQPFREAADGYGRTVGGNFPDQTSWVSLGAEVVEGDSTTWDPPPPRDTHGFGSDSLRSPVIRLDRKDLGGAFYSGTDVGDTLTSFPVNLQGKSRIDLSFDYFRGGRFHYPWGWDSMLMLGPERTITDSAGNAMRTGDSLILEFKRPGEPFVNPSPASWDYIAAIDGRHDFEFKSFIAEGTQNSWKVTIDGITTTLSTPNYFDSNFRFRLRLKSKNDVPKPSSSADDDDPWFIDNVNLQWPALPELEVRWIRIVSPYTKIPQSQAIFPVVVRIRNYGAALATAVPIRVAIVDPSGDTTYSQRVMLASLSEGGDTVLRFPDWDATSQSWSNGAKYEVLAKLDAQGFDDYADDDETYSNFFLDIAGETFNQEFALDDAGIEPVPGGGNDIPRLAGLQGTGIGFSDTTGSLAVKFQLLRTDTVYGVKAYFGNANQANDPIRISLLKGDSNSCSPSDTISTFRDVRAGGFFNQIWPYYFPRPVVLPKGVYWIAVSQLSSYSMQLGGDVSRGGGEIVTMSNGIPQIRSMYASSSQSVSLGTEWGSDPADNNSDVTCSFAFEIPAGSGNWKSLMPEVGWWPAMDSASGLWPTLVSSKLDSATWTDVGTYLPIIRPIVGTYYNDAAVAPLRVESGEQLVARPNPFDPSSTSTRVSFFGVAKDYLSLMITNVMGVPVRRFVISAISNPSHNVCWDGRDENGNIVPAGPYFVSVFSSGFRLCGKIIVKE